MIKAIVAVTKNNGIGYDNNILYNIKADQRRFREFTLGHHCVMGMNTYNSFPKYVQPLPMRINDILSRAKTIEDLGDITIADDYKDSTHVFVYNDPNKLLAKTRGLQSDVWIIGGEQIYKLFMPVVEQIELTQIFRTKSKQIFS